MSMVRGVGRKLVEQFMFGELQSRQAVIRRSFRMALKLSLLVCGLNFLALVILSLTGVLQPYDLHGAMLVALLLTPAAAFVIAMPAYCVAGYAFYDLMVSRDELERLSLTDTLSGLSNRRAFFAAYKEISGDAALVIFDIDRFKAINDTHGHKAGDDVIVAVARVIRLVFPADFVCARLGGEEFAAIAQNYGMDELRHLAERVRVEVAGLRFVYEGAMFSVTVSAGYAAARGKPDFSTLFGEADKALYAAKQGGRNKVVSLGETGRVSRGEAAVRGIGRDGFLSSRRMA